MSKNRNRNNRSTRVAVKENTDLGTGFGTVGFTDSVSDNYAEGEFKVNFDDNMPQSEPLMLTDGNSTRYGSLVTIEKTKKEKPKRLKVNPEGMKNCIIFLIGLVFVFLPMLIRPLFNEMAEVSKNKFEEIQTPNMSGIWQMASSLSMMLTFIGLAFIMLQVFKIMTALTRGEPIELAPFEFEYKTVEKETVKDFYCKSPKELEESDKNREKDPNKTTSMGVIYK